MCWASAGSWNDACCFFGDQLRYRLSSLGGRDRYAFDWNKQFDLSLDPERSRDYHDATLPADINKQAGACLLYWSSGSGCRDYRSPVCLSLRIEL
jgi:hypothetical protein